MTKSLITLFVLSLAIISCQKERVCNCTVVTTGTTETKTYSELLAVDTTVIIPLNTSNVSKIKFNKVTKKKANFNCIDRSEEINETTSNGLPGILDISITNKGTRTYNCELE